jgi:arylsulfatase A-like enzyme
MIQEKRPDLWEAANHRPGFDTSMAFEAFPTPIPLELHRSTCITDNAIRLLEQRDKDKPFFLHLSYWDPHHPFDPPHPYDTLYEGKPIKEPLPHTEEEFKNLPAHFQEWYTHIWNREGKPFCDHTLEDWRVIIRLYYSMITLIDDGIGRVIEVLKKEKIYDDTIIIFSADHGELLGDHGIATKGGFFYEGLLKVPLIIKLENQTQKKTIETPVMNFDIMPTLLDLLNIETPDCTAVSLLPLLEDRGGFDQPIYIEGTQGEMACLIDYPYKLIVYQDNRSGQLYNLEKDPNEYHNIWGVPETEDMLANLIKTQLRLFTKGGKRDSLW